MEEPGRLQSMGSLRVGHVCLDEECGLCVDMCFVCLQNQIHDMVILVLGDFFN